MKVASEPRRKAGAGRAFFRRAPFLVCYWQGKQLYFENYLTRKKIAASLETAALLDFFSGWKREETVFRRWPQYTRKSLRHAIRRLTQESFLQQSSVRNLPGDLREKALKNWKAWNPAASFFHMQTKDSYGEQISSEEIRWVEELLEIAGGDPVFPQLRQHQSAKDRIVDPATVIGANPEVIIVSWCGRKVSKDQIRQREGWNSIDAIRAGHIYEVKSTYILQPGPAALTEGVRQLHAILARVAQCEPSRELEPAESLDPDVKGSRV